MKVVFQDQIKEEAYNINFSMINLKNEALQFELSKPQQTLIIKSSELIISQNELKNQVLNTNPSQQIIHEDHVAHVDHIDHVDHAGDFKHKQTLFERIQGGIACWILTVIAIGAVPPINLLLFFFQPSGLAESASLSNQAISNLGVISDYKLFYVVMGLYVFVSSIVLAYAWQFRTFYQRIKLIFMVDHMMMVMIATDTCYIGLHLLCFCSVYNASQQTYILSAQIKINIQDIFVIILFSLTSLIVSGGVRIFVISAHWKHWQIILLKIIMGGSAILYFILGLIFLLGKDSLDYAVQKFVEQYSLYVIQIFADPNSPYHSYIPYFQNYNSSLKENTLIIANFTVVYLIANFTFYFELVHKISQFDGTAELKTHYTFVEQPEQ